MLARRLSPANDLLVRSTSFDRIYQTGAETRYSVVRLDMNVELDMMMLFCIFNLAKHDYNTCALILPDATDEEPEAKSRPLDEMSSVRNLRAIGDALSEEGEAADEPISFEIYRFSKNGTTRYPIESLYKRDQPMGSERRRNSARWRRKATGKISRISRAGGQGEHSGMVATDGSLFGLSHDR